MPSFSDRTPEDIARELDADLARGLSMDEAARRLRSHGANVFEARPRATFGSVVLGQLKSPLVAVLLLGGVATIILGEFLDALVISIALAINVFIGTLQENRASRAFDRLTASQVQYATVIRDGRHGVVRAADLVTGDIVELASGAAVPADVRLTSASNLLTNEAALTGEWAPVVKDTELRAEGVPLIERSNIAWMGTLVVSGRGAGIVVATGAETELGKIAAELILPEERPTPMQVNLRHLAHFMLMAVVCSLVFIVALSLVRGRAFVDVILLSVAVAVATMPAGLPAAVTVVLAIGMERILQRGGLVRNLIAAETLGSTTVILTDKTGTLTEGTVALEALYPAELLEESDRAGLQAAEKTAQPLLRTAILAAESFITESEREPEKFIVHGRPLEKAIVAAGLAEGVSRVDLERLTPRLDVLAFDSTLRFSGSLHAFGRAGGTRGKEASRFSVVGAPELILEHAQFLERGSRRVRMSAAYRARALGELERLARGGLRVVGIGYRSVSWIEIPDGNRAVRGVGDGAEPHLLQSLVFLGLIALRDPLRSDAAAAVETAHSAGARVIMVTGDNIETARRVAYEASVAPRGAIALTGADVEKLTDLALGEALERTEIFARMLPEHKLRLVRVLKNRGEVVAMTGDGVNDAPALISSDIGIALGSGTDVAKEAADIVLVNNSFSVIIAAIEEGRRIIDNLKKIVAYLLSTSFSEVIVIGGSLIAGGPLPLLPAQILWTNIIEEGFMNFAFAFEPKEPDLMRRSPRESTARIVVTREMRWLIAMIAAVTGALLLALYFLFLRLDLPEARLRTLMFVALSIDSIFFSFSLKNLREPVWKLNLFSNRYLLMALTSSITLLFTALFFPPVRTLLSLVPLGAPELLFLLGVGLVNLATIEVGKWFVFRRRRRQK
ncbi:MAG: cation-transporting P-type ATPase [bacterium]|nr:cation-transporting P-type ATPase [bacterium]MDZ4285258.1 cation-transporting P-type ATPase [Patescibacteria group bacterium]